MILRFGEPTPLILTKFVPLTNGFQHDEVLKEEVLGIELGLGKIF
jgi:hypothetical protein